jgi:hypothetical protein
MLSHQRARAGGGLAGPDQGGGAEPVDLGGRGDRLAGQLVHLGDGLGGLGGPAPFALGGQADDGLQLSQGVSAAKLVADRAVGPVQPWSRSGPAQHGTLVAQHQQPGVLEGRRPAEQDQPAAGPDEDQVKQANRHGRSSSPTADHAASLQLTSRADFWHPTARGDDTLDSQASQVRNQNGESLKIARQA